MGSTSLGLPGFPFAIVFFSFKVPRLRSETQPAENRRAFLYSGNISGIQKHSSLSAGADKIRFHSGFLRRRPLGRPLEAEGFIPRCNVMYKKFTGKKMESARECQRVPDCPEGYNSFSFPVSLRWEPRVHALTGEHSRQPMQAVCSIQ